MHDRRRALALLAALVALPAAAGWVRFTDDGLTPGATAIRSGCVAPGQYERPLTPLARTVTIEGLPDSGRCYFALNAGPQDEWIFDFATERGVRAAPGAVRNVNVTWSPTPPGPAVTVTINAYSTSSGEFDLAIAGTGPVTLRLTSLQLDWCKPGGENGSTATPTTPNLGVPNNDGVLAQGVTFAAPVTRTRCDIDPNTAFPGASATVSGVTKPLTPISGGWGVSF